MSRAPAGARTTIVLLAGGHATRLPGKLTLPIDGEPMLVRVFRRLADGKRPILISARVPLEAPLAAAIDAPVVLDECGDVGPLGGLVSAATHVVTPLLFAAAGDLPNIDGAFVEELEAGYDRIAATGQRAEAFVPKWSEADVEPLAALYQTAALVRAGRRALDAGERRVTAVLRYMQVTFFGLRDQDEAQLANVNTPTDYESFGH